MSGTVIPACPNDARLSRRSRTDPAPGAPAGGRGLSRRALLTGLGGLAVAAAWPSPAAVAAADGRRQIAETIWRTADLTGGVGSGSGLALTAHGVRLAAPTGQRSYADPYTAGAGTLTYESAFWDSPVITPAFAWTELIASWNADTPAGTWVEVLVRGLDPAGSPTAWFVMGRWSAADVGDGGAIQRTSVPGQRAFGASVATDTLQTGGGAAFRSWQLRVVLLRRAGTAASPTLRLAGAVTTAVPPAAATNEPISAFGGMVGTLDVPAYSQELHAGHHPAWGGGGESWCSAATTAMLLDYWGAGPTASERAWVRPPVDAQVDVVARSVYDAAYGGTGNWPFNTAYAGTRTTAGVPMEGYVTRLPDLAAAEPFIRAGVPLGVSLSFRAEQLTGAGYGTDGHLMALVGFDRAGNPVVNDPASHLAADNGRVRATYQRGQFEAAWANSGRTAYVVRPGTPAMSPEPAGTGLAGPSVSVTRGDRAIRRRR